MDALLPVEASRDTWETLRVWLERTVPACPDPERWVLLRLLADLARLLDRAAAS
ncbi:MAG: hypothetical protein K6V97_11075 [Actinomycetia bacterium]|nr:hypothetical protein [Actinomycetes bacterium]